MKHSRTHLALTLCALLALAAMPAYAAPLPAMPFAYADLAVDGLAAGATVAQAVAQLGQPMEQSEIATEAATGSTQQTLAYEGLTLTFTDGLLSDAALTNAGHTGPRGIAVGMAQAALDTAFSYDASQAKDGVLYAAGWVESLGLPLPPCAKALTYDDGSTVVQYLSPVSPYSDALLASPEAFLYEAHAGLAVTLDAEGAITAVEWHVRALAE